MNANDFVAAILAPVPWSKLRGSGGQVADRVPELVKVLVCELDPDSREAAGGQLYCIAANQDVLGEVSPSLADILVQVLRQDACLDREAVYDLLQSIQECRSWCVRDDAFGEELFVKTRAAIEAGWSVYLDDLHRLDLERHPSLLVLLWDLAAKHLEVLVHLKRAISRADGKAEQLLEEAFADALEHAQQHTVDPGRCYCGEAFWLDASLVGRAVSRASLSNPPSD